MTEEFENLPLHRTWLDDIVDILMHRPNGQAEAEAIAKIKESIRLTPVYPPWIVTLLAAAYRESGDIGRSISAAKHSIRLSPVDLDARLILCSDYNIAGRREQAQRLVSDIVKIDPAFSIAKYAEYQPYKDKETLQRLCENLREAGLAE